MLLASLFDELGGQRGSLAGRDHPADNVAAEDVEDDVEVVVSPLRWAAQFGDVPAPQPMGGGGQQFWLLIRGMRELIAAFTRSAVFF